MNSEITYKKNKNVYKKILGGTYDIIDNIIYGVQYMEPFIYFVKNGKIFSAVLNSSESKMDIIRQVDTEKNVKQFNLINTVGLAYIDDSNNLRYVEYYSHMSPHDRFRKERMSTRRHEKIISNVSRIFKGVSGFAESLCIYLKGNKLFSLTWTDVGGMPFAHNATEIQLATNLTNITGFAKSLAKIFGIYACISDNKLYVANISNIYRTVQVGEMFAQCTEGPNTHVAELVPGYDNVTEVAMYRHYDILFINNGTLYTYMFRNPDGSNIMTVDKTVLNNIEKIRVYRNSNSIAILYKNGQLCSYKLKRDDYGPLQISGKKIIAEKVLTMDFIAEDSFWYVAYDGTLLAFVNGHTIDTKIRIETYSKYFYPLDLVTYPMNEHDIQKENDKERKAEVTAMSLMATHNPYINASVDDILTDVFSYGVDR